MHSHAPTIRAYKEEGGVKEKYARLRTAKVIYDSFMRIFIALKCGYAPPSAIIYFEFDIDNMINKVWVDQRTIGWDQILKGRVSKYRGQVQCLYYQNNPATRGNTYFSSLLWSAITLRILLDFSLHL